MGLSWVQELKRTVFRPPLRQGLLACIPLGVDLNHLDLVANICENDETNVGCPGSFQLLFAATLATENNCFPKWFVWIHYNLACLRNLYDEALSQEYSSFKQMML